MFLRSLLLAVLCGPAMAQGGNIDQEPLVISNEPKYIARLIFTGSDHAMPTDGRFKLSIAPTIKDGNILIPATISEAFREMERALPHWYQAALITSRGDFECFVSVNNVDLNFIVMSWLWVNWRLEEPDSELRIALENMGAEHRDQVLSGIHDGFCFYLKYGEEKAMELLTAPADEDEEERVLLPLESTGCEEQ